ncbi:GNAT superfamily N-acetyltransferase [Pelomonas aquatica]|uniref:GNAT superfamily N-acetyltransferase n=1 Tax=Pelomonas aquatica TaxID=431058 RepID=A0ABU1Z9J3_9BURK|nr:GNAT family N-acetyltransferase [Pelomonas aquatica]MDR7296716.1 GNAT superfamily N-acetyltransferase [Pelomonas aquatica]
MNLEDLLAAWGRGWAASRATPAPEPLGEGAWRIKVGLPGHRRRDLLPAWPPDRLRAWADGVAAPGAWIKALADPATLALPAAWVMQPTEYLMSTPLQATAPPALTPGYRAELTAGAAALECHVLAADGQLAAQARVGLAGPHAVFDQVVTQETHRRRGLARHAMALLAGAALDRGAREGLLVATADGRALYAAQGWRLDSPMTAACVPEAVA